MKNRTSELERLSDKIEELKKARSSLDGKVARLRSDEETRELMEKVLSITTPDGRVVMELSRES